MGECKVFCQEIAYIRGGDINVLEISGFGRVEIDKASIDTIQLHSPNGRTHINNSVLKWFSTNQERVIIDRASLLKMRKSELDGVEVYLARNITATDLWKCMGWDNDFHECRLRSQRNIVKGAYVQFDGHGERGRTLSAFDIKGKGRWYFCGCFSGSQKELETYIKAHALNELSQRGQRIRHTRLWAYKTVNAFLDGGDHER